MPRGSKRGERRGGRQRATPNKRTALTDRILAAASEHPSASQHELFAIACGRQSNCGAEIPDRPRIAINRLNRYEATLRRQLARSCLCLMPWIAANHRKGGAFFPAMMGRPARSKVIDYALTTRPRRSPERDVGSNCIVLAIIRAGACKLANLSWRRRNSPRKGARPERRTRSTKAMHQDLNALRRPTPTALHQIEA